MANILLKRGTRAALDAAAAESRLTLGEPYYVTDLGVIALGAGPDSYVLQTSQGGGPSVSHRMAYAAYLL